MEESVEGLWNSRRTFRMDMETYISTMRSMQRKMLKEDPQTTINDQAYAVRLLKRSGLTGQERRQVPAGANLRNLGTQVSRTRPRARNCVKPFLAHVDDANDDEDELLLGDDEEEGEQAHAADLVGADEDDDWDDEEFASAGEEHDALATFLSSKQRLARVGKQNRRGGPSSSGSSQSSRSTAGMARREPPPESIAQKKAKSKCADCGRWGRWHGDPECERVKSGSTPARAANTMLASVVEDHEPVRVAATWSRTFVGAGRVDHRRRDGRVVHFVGVTEVVDVL